MTDKKKTEVTKRNEYMEDKQLVTIDKQLFSDACRIIEQAQEAAFRSVNVTLIKRNWLLGMRIQHEVLKDKRAEYGERVVANLAKSLTDKYGEGFIKRNLHYFVDFYLKHPDFFYMEIGAPEIVNAAGSQLPTMAENKIVNAASSQSSVIETDIFHAVSGKSVNMMESLVAKSPILLSWTHYRIILQENSQEARDWYEQEAAREMWGTRTLQRNVSSQYYHRLLQSQNKALVHDEMVKVGVFYNYNLRSFVLIDLKTTKLCHQDVGQMDMYVRMYDELMCPQGHNPTIGLILFADTDDDVAHYSVLNGSDQLFAAKYLTYMPKREDLRREIEQQKEFFRLQHKGDKELGTDSTIG